MEVMTQEIVMSALYSSILLILISPYFPIRPHSPLLPSVSPKKAVAVALCYSLFLLSIHLAFGSETVSYHFNWLNALPFDLNIGFYIDSYTVFFTTVALYVSLAIFYFAEWYMHSDPNMDKFFKYMTAFLVSMLILVSANNLFQIFIGWEGVGIMSFLLISWWHGRAEANLAALQAMLYNRLGDIGFLVALAWSALILGSWDVQQTTLDMKNMDISIPAFALLAAACAKSAQFGLHHWLPSAMEGPTPVSALLHSSTMVVAGVFMLVRMAPMLVEQKAMLSLCLCMGALTTLFGAACALTQFDMKKIVAYSTSSQLGLMMTAIGVSHPQMAFLHICTHAFFKAMMFISAGNIIHYLDNEQDIRKMGGMKKLAPMTSTAIIIGSLAITGTPFLAGFYSKDAILEALSSSYMNAWAFILVIVATSFSAAYSFRLIYYVLLGHPRFSPRAPLNENNPAVALPLLALSMGSIIAGALISYNLIPLVTPVSTFPTSLKLAGLTASLSGFILAYDITRLTYMIPKTSPVKTVPLPLSLFIFSNLLAFIPTILHRFFPLMAFLLGHTIAGQIVDSITAKKIGPKLITKFSQKMSAHVNTLHWGLAKICLTFFLMTLVISVFLTAHYAL
uniref:NADH-ubiquinone oxidoreductase chain 5 n=1 Tax=Moolgarda perusii TaxID=1111165 RepID=A0A7L9R5A6_9TELE|nr:NADH dehydrogenase subunit 5 [Moolgarda perusii]QOL10563.1 NADH dehydrogenase subunit 5 [Moolgarda perusii]